MLPPANIATDGGWGARTRADVLGAVDTLISSLIGIAWPITPPWSSPSMDVC
jgi:hypothetical protein